MKLNSKRLLKNLFSASAVLLFLLFFVSACTKTEKKNAGIAVRIEEQSTEYGTIVQIPVFYSENEEVEKNLRDLEKETASLQRIVEKAQKKGTYMEMRCYQENVENYPQVTVVWYTAEENTRVYNLMTLAADEKESLPVTCREALERTQMTGVDLSLRVGKLEQESEVRGKLQSTEMQGFRIDENGEVAEIYMKLSLLTGEGEKETEEEHFFSYDLKEEILVSLSEKGFDIP